MSASFNREYSIRRAVPGDAPQVVELVRSSFRPRDLDLTIYGCTGVATYLAQEFAIPLAISASCHLVATSGDLVIGHIEMRRSAGPLWLNYVAVNAGWRRQSVGQALIREGLRAAGEKPGTDWVLDVFEHNTGAHQWFTHMGFRAAARSGFWSIDNRPAAAERNGNVVIAGLPEADAAHARFGFSRFTVTQSDVSFLVGRLGDRWLRISDPRILQAEYAMAALRSIEPSRSLLLCCPESRFDPASAPGCERFLTSIRYQSATPYAD